MASKLAAADVERIAELARLRLSSEEITLFATQLTDILRYAEQVQQVDTTGVDPTSHPLGGGASWRDDAPEASLDRSIVLANAPGADLDAGVFQVPKVRG